MFNSRLGQTLPRALDVATFDIDDIEVITSPELRMEVLRAVSSSIQVCRASSHVAGYVLTRLLQQTIWAICSPCLVVAFVVGAFTVVFLEVISDPSHHQISLFLRNLDFNPGSQSATECAEKSSARLVPQTASVTGGAQVV